MTTVTLMRTNLSLLLPAVYNRLSRVAGMHSIDSFALGTLLRTTAISMATIQLIHGFLLHGARSAAIDQEQQHLTCKFATRLTSQNTKTGQMHRNLIVSVCRQVCGLGETELRPSVRTHDSVTRLHGFCRRQYSG